ncbi:DUF2076 domain-containing protein [Labrys sp. La1]|uniref:DUF2076 domain-containing protein n=1 Tax=Labrys sp. La1 TaxID=3404917 RepID=UPI003EBFBDFE
MTPNEKALIEDLFNRLRSSAPTTGRDAEAETAIAAEMARSPGAAYALVQTVLVQDHALREAHAKVQAAEAAAQQPQQVPQPPEQPQSFIERAGSALQGFGGQRNQAQQQQVPPQQAEPARGGGFLQGALQTAAGVAGGALLFEGVRSMFGGGGGLLGGGSSPFGGGGNTTINETVINENADKGRDSDDNVRDASYDSDDDDDGDYGSDDSGGSDDSWI